MTTYIAGPMRGRYLYNYYAFVNASELFENVMNPNDVHPARVFPTWDNAVSSIEGTCDPNLPWKTWDYTVEPFGTPLNIVEGDLKMLLQCTHIYMLKGWETSVGAKAEHTVAVWLGLEISYEA